MYYRGLETRIAEKHGIRMCSADTIGPAGAFRSLREIPEALAIAKDAEELCPDACIKELLNAEKEALPKSAEQIIRSC